jgi:hypothetical protein
MNPSTKRFLLGGEIGIAVMIFGMIAVTGISIALNSVTYDRWVAAPAATVFLPVSTTKMRMHAAWMQNLSHTDERYIQCQSDADTCTDMSFLGNALPLLADAVIWFFIGGLVNSLFTTVRSIARG